jgi:hypothetical protein
MNTTNEIFIIINETVSNVCRNGQHININCLIKETCNPLKADIVRSGLILVSAYFLFNNLYLYVVRFYTH